ncbi:MAG: NAD(P)-binding protein [Deltaproteobacteria bacterium]|nr:NAD(P)-binding protein [Deltaproteobacteria bacterium]
MEISRRKFLKSAFVVAAGMALPGAFYPCMRPKRSIAGATPAGSDPSPFSRVAHPNDSAGFIGDRPSPGHGILWDKKRYLASMGGIPPVTESASVVIVGGGVSGLVAAYALRDLNPVLLEQSSQFGGNAKAERWGDLEYALGSAYISRPEKGSATATMLEELGLLGRSRSEFPPDEEATLVRGKMFRPLWQGATDPARAREFTRVRDRLLAIYENEYPAIPAKTAADAARLRELDRMSFAEWVRRDLGPIHPHLEELFHEYCWDAMGGAYDEVSAAQALNFITADLNGIVAFPGGNATIAEALYRGLESAQPKQNLRPGSFVIDIEPQSSGGGVRVTYKAPDGSLKSIHAKACIVTSPKFIAKVLISGMPSEQQEAISRLEYRAFLVANVLLDGEIPSSSFGMFHLRGRVPQSPDETVKMASERAYTSVVFANWAAGHGSSKSVLTLYKPFPYKGGRFELSKPDAYQIARARFEKAIPKLLRSFDADPKRVAGLRILRMAHAMPVAAQGLLADGTLELAARTVAGRIFLAQQDNWANPCVETALAVALQAAGQARNAVV